MADEHEMATAMVLGCVCDVELMFDVPRLVLPFKVWMFSLIIFCIIDIHRGNL